MDRSQVLPSIPLPTDSVEVGGYVIKFRSLSRAEALKVTTEFKDNVDGAEIFILACGTGVSEEDAKAWRDTTDPITAGKVVDGIIMLTGLASTDAKNA
jgi:hypothetical protein